MTDVNAPAPETKDHLWANFDKLLVTFLLLVCGGIAVFLILKKADDAALQWAESLAGSMASALLALLGAAKWSQRQSNGSGQSTPEGK